MIISHRHKFIFFDQPYSGGENLRAYLQTWSEEPVVDIKRHAPDQPFYHGMSPEEARRTFEMLGWRFADYVRISTTSNPFVRIPAVYEELQRGTKIRRFRNRFMGTETTLEQWLESIAGTHHGIGSGPSSRRLDHAMRTSAQWCGDGLITRFVPVETLRKAAVPLLASLGIPSPPDLSSLCTVPKDIALSERAEHLIAERFAADIQLFDYTRPSVARAA